MTTRKQKVIIETQESDCTLYRTYRKTKNECSYGGKLIYHYGSPESFNEKFTTIIVKNGKKNIQ